MTIYKEAKNEKGVLKVFYDEYPESPREWDNLGKMFCFHRRYNLGDKHQYRADDYNNWNEFLKAIKKDYNVAIVLPLYMYDHSGITISTSPFSCHWDSGQIGWVFVTKEDIRNEYNMKRISKNLLEKVEKVLISEVEIYDDYVRGDVFGYRLENSEGEEIDSCYGFYGDNAIKDIMTHIPEEYILLAKSMI